MMTIWIIWAFEAFDCAISHICHICIAHSAQADVKLLAWNRNHSNDASAGTMRLPEPG